MKEKIIKGIRNPWKVPPYLGRRIRNKDSLYRKYVRNRNACIYQSTGFSDIPTEGRDGIRETFFGDLELGRQYHNFLTYLKLCDFAHYSGCRSVLEIGAGYSTAIWAEYADQTRAEITTVDGNFDLLESWVAGTEHEQKIEENVNLVEGASVGPEEVRQFYSEPLAGLGGVEVARFAKDLDRFARAEGAPTDNIKKMDRLAPTRNWSVKDLIVADGELYFPEEFLNTYTIWTENFEDYLSMLEDVPRKGVVDDLAEDSKGWDLIWFDSGEISSMLEWHKYKKYVNPGGLAAFHDVFFPKSMKNFVVGASLLRDPNWEVLLVDETTKQGLMIARRTSDER